MSAEKKTIQIFIAYSQKDRTELDALRTHAAPLLRKGNVRIWFDGEIIPGEAWDTAIKANLHAADIILMLLSSNSLASDYFYEQEVKDALKRHEAGTARVVPVVLSACLWQETPLADLQGLPKGMKPINSWPNREDAWHDVLLGVSSMIRELEKGSLSDDPKPITSPTKPATAEAHAWEFTLEDDNRAAYEKHLTRFPEGVYATEARERLDAFDADDILWELVSDRGTEKAFQKYLDKYPNGLHAAEAKQQIVAFELERQEAARKKREQEEAAQKAESARKNKELEVVERRRRIDPFYDLMVPIKGGTFEMGDTFGDGFDREQPVHKVTLSDYWLCKYPVTQGLWKAIMGENNNPSYFKGDDLLPVEQVSWDDAQEFIQALNKKTGGQYRLPTEAEWEYAARAAPSPTREGRGGAKVRFGNGKDDANPAEMNFNAKADYKQPYSIVGEYREKTTPVNQFKPNALGLYDMAGNVYDWCADWFAADYYQQCHAQGTVLNPQGPDTGESRVLRGGYWGYSPRDCRAAYRYPYPPTFGVDNVGFRVASSLQ